MHNKKYQNFNKISFLLSDNEFFRLVKIELSGLIDLKFEWKNKKLELNVINEWLLYVFNKTNESIIQLQHDQIPNIDTINDHFYDHFRNDKIIGILPYYPNDSTYSLNDIKYYCIISEPK